jgi:hypothetical protein
MMQRRSTIDAGPERTPKIPVNGSSQCASHGACATATTGYRQEGCRHLDPAPVPAFPVQSSEPDARAYLALQVYVAWRRVDPCAGGRGRPWCVPVVLSPVWCAPSHSRSPSLPGSCSFVRVRRGRGRGGFEALRRRSRKVAARPDGWLPCGCCCVRRPCVTWRLSSAGPRSRGRTGRGGAVHARILGSLTARGREGTSLSRSRISRAGLVRPGGGMRRRSRTELVASCVTSSPGPSVAAERRRQAAGPGTGSGGGLFYPAVRPVCRARIVSIGGRAVAVIYYWSPSRCSCAGCSGSGACQNGKILQYVAGGSEKGMPKKIMHIEEWLYCF